MIKSKILKVFLITVLLINTMFYGPVINMGYANEVTADNEATPQPTNLNLLSQADTALTLTTEPSPSPTPGMMVLPESVSSKTPDPKAEILPVPSTVPYDKTYIENFNSAQNSELINSTQSASTIQYSYESEAQNNTLSGALRRNSANCSGGMIVGWIGYGRYLRFNDVFVDAPGTYNLSLYYCSAENRSAYISINGAYDTKIDFTSTGSWDTVGVKTVTIKLNSPFNTIKIYNDYGNAPDFDKISLDSISLTSINNYEAESKENTFYNSNISSASGSSNGGIVGYVGMGRYFQFNNISVKTSGIYNIQFDYFSGENRSAYISVNGEAGIKIDFPSMVNWNTIGKITVPVILNKVNNTIKVYNDSGWAPDFDKISLELVKTLPENIYEAESSVNTLYNSYIYNNSVCSGGKYVGAIGNGSYIEFNKVIVSESGQYAMTIQYISEENRIAYYSINGGNGVKINFPGTGSPTDMGTMTVLIGVYSSNNSIRFYNDSSWAPDIDRISIKNGSIMKEPSLNSNSNLAAISINGLVYSIGGHNYLENGTNSNVSEYNPSTDLWISKPNQFPIPRWEFAHAVYNNKIYIFGGTKDGSKNLVDTYNPATDTWEAETTMNSARQGHGAAVVNGKIYLIGGKDDDGYLGTVEEYDPVNKSWISKTSMLTPRAGFSIATVNNKIYVMGGHNNDADYLNILEIYDPATDTWTATDNMPTKRTGCEAAVVNNKIYVIGGFNGNYLNTIEEYDPSTGIWSMVPGLLNGRTAFGAAVLNGKIYILGGINSTGYLNSVEEYIPL